ncbi:MAG TPA: cytochrome c peroxidase [Byssovorax sp.]|jgi:cytochrome c peroxidase
MRFRVGTIGLSLAVVGCIGACAKGRSAPEEAKSTDSPPASDARAASGDCRVQKKSGALVPVGEAGRGSTVALVDLDGRRVALVADEDARAVLAFDTERGVELPSTPLDAVPSQLVVLADGRVVVGLRDRAKIAVLERGDDALHTLARRCDVDVAAEPVGLAATPDGETVLVTSGWGHALTALDAATMTKAFEVDLPREPRAVVASASGTRAFVAHAVGGRMTSVDLDAARKAQAAGVSTSGATTLVNLDPGSANGAATGPASAAGLTSCQGYAIAAVSSPGARLLAPAVAVDPGDREARSAGYGNASQQPPEQATVAVIDEDTSKPVPETLVGRASALPEDHAAECLLPRAAAVDAESGTLLVACYGVDSVVAYDAMAPVPAAAPLRRYHVGGGPSGLAIDPKTGDAWVFSQFERTLTKLSVRDVDPMVELKKEAPPVVATALAPLPATADGYKLAIGRQLFHAVNDARISADGRACASCHPDGRDDALTWSTPDGPRRTAMLAGRLSGTAPYGWTGASKDLREHITQTFSRLKGTGVSSLELDALLTYAQSLAPPRGDVAVSDAAERGAKVFHAVETGCATCHRDEAGFTDGQRHNVASRANADRSATFDTPSLRFVGHRAPYFHDGRYATLAELLRDTSSTMGSTQHLKPADLEDLEAYLRTL